MLLLGGAVNILVTGATGFLGSHLLPLLEKGGHRVWGLYRNPKQKPQVGVPIQGDVKQPGLGLTDTLPQMDALLHCAAVVDLVGNKDLVWQTNAQGTHNALSYCVAHNIRRFYLVSTAYTQGLNHYEVSKAQAEKHVEKFRYHSGLRTTVFKPGILIGGKEQASVAARSAFYRVVASIARVHRRAEQVRRKVEETVRLPVLEPVLRIPGAPEGPLNLVPVDWVAQSIVQCLTEEGTIYLVDPNPRPMAEISRWVSEVLYLNIRVESHFTATPIERALARLLRPYLPYMRGVSFPSGIVLDGLSPPGVDREHIQMVVCRDVLGVRGPQLVLPQSEKDGKDDRRDKEAY